MQELTTLSTKEAAVRADCHSSEIYGAIYEGKLQTVQGAKPYRILPESFDRWRRVRHAKRALVQEERQLASASA